MTSASALEALEALEPRMYEAGGHLWLDRAGRRPLHIAECWCWHRRPRRRTSLWSRLFTPIPLQAPPAGPPLQERHP